MKGVGLPLPGPVAPLFTLDEALVGVKEDWRANVY